MRRIFAFSLFTKKKYYDKGDMIFSNTGESIGRVLRCSKNDIDLSDVFYSYDIESDEETFKKLQAKEIPIYRIDDYSVHDCLISYIEGI